MQMIGYDLFTGIGGLTIAAHSVFKDVSTVLYCDIDKNAQTIITSKLMPRYDDRRGSVLHTDIRTLKKETYPNLPPPDLITCGFPCKGFSSSGNKQGTDHPETGLVSDLLRYIGEVKPSYVFMENVASILWTTHTEHYTQIMMDLLDMGYECRWMTIRASDLGAPHKRDRWFCLCTRTEPTKRRGIRLMPPVKISHWDREPCDRLGKRTKNLSKRACMLGNACVPQQAATALLALWQDLGNTQRQPIGSLDAMSNLKSFPPYGGVSRQGMTEHPRPDVLSRLKPRTWKLEFRVPGHVFGQETDVEYTKSGFTTPTSQCVYPATRLTRRSIRDFATQVSLEKETKPRNAREATVVNIEFVEWIMGFEPGWTNFA